MLRLWSFLGSFHLVVGLDLPHAAHGHLPAVAVNDHVAEAGENQRAIPLRVAVESAGCGRAGLGGAASGVEACRVHRSPLARAFRVSCQWRARGRR